MFVKWNISKDDLETGLERLKNVTYSQKKFSPKLIIEKSHPMSRFKFHGVINEKTFMISPVVLGYNRCPPVLYGTIAKKAEEFELSVRVKPVPAARIIWVVCMLWIAFCLCIGHLGSGSTWDYREIGVIVMGILVSILLQWFININAQEALTFLQDIFNPDNV